MGMDAIWQRLITLRPLAVLTRCIMGSVLNEELDQVFEEHRSRQYSREILFSQLARTIADVVLGLSQSPFQAYQKFRQELRASSTAFYEKLKRVEPRVSEAMVRHSYQKARLLQQALGQEGREPIAGYHCRMLDGNHLQKTEHRIDELRCLAAAPLPGTVVATLELKSNLLDRAYVLEDAHDQECSVLDRLLEDVAARDLLVADRHFCVVGFLLQLASRRAGFVIRQHGRLKGKLLGKRRRIGRIETGVVYEQRMQIGQAEDQPRRIVRRITIELDEPTRDGDREIHVLSNVLREEATACQLAELYRQRWAIEHAFYVLTMTLTSEVEGLGHPLAALFVFCMAMVAYNCSRVLTASLCAAHGQAAVNELSDYSLAHEIAQTTDAALVMITDEEWNARVPSDPRSRARFLIDVARHLDLPRHRKSRRGPKKKPPPRTGYRNGGHVATARILARRSKRC
jgi:Transposase DDE domain